MIRKSEIAAILLFLIVLAACGSEKNGSNESSESQVAPENQPIQTTIIGGRTGGAWSVFTEGIAESIRKKNENALVTVEPGGIVENPAAVGTAKIPYGISYSMTAYAAYMGEEPYDTKFEDIRSVSVVIPANYYQFIALADTPYDSFDEIIEGKAPVRLALDQKGSAGEIITRNILQEYGVTYEDIISWDGSIDHLGGSKTFELMADNRIDATGDAVSVPSGDILEASTAMDLKMLSLNQETITAVSDKLGMEAGTIKAGSYSFLETDIDTVSTPAILMVHKDISKEEVYQITKSIYESFDYLGTVHEEFKNLTDENFADVGKVPFHPGAEKFYKEIGLIE